MSPHSRSFHPYVTPSSGDFAGSIMQRTMM